MEIVNNVENKSHIIEFEGKEYDLQLSMYVIARYKNYEDIMNCVASGSFLEIAKLIAHMMNSYIIKNKLDWDMIDVDYLTASLDIHQTTEFINTLCEALGFKKEEPTELESQIEEALADEDIPEFEKN